MVEEYFPELHASSSVVRVSLPTALHAIAVSALRPPRTARAMAPVHSWSTSRGPSAGRQKCFYGFDRASAWTKKWVNSQLRPAYQSLANFKSQVRSRFSFYGAMTYKPSDLARLMGSAERRFVVSPGLQRFANEACYTLFELLLSQ